MSDHWIPLLRSGKYQRQRKPDLIPSVKLENYLRHVSNHRALAKAIAYSLCTEVEERNSDHWLIAKRSSSRPLKEWQMIAVFSYKKQVETLKDLLIVDYSLSQFAIADQREVGTSDQSYNQDQLKLQVLEELQLISSKGLPQ